MPDTLEKVVNRATRFVHDNQPVSLTAVGPYVAGWVFAPLAKTLYRNLTYNPAMPKVVVYCVHGTADRPSSFTKIASRLVGRLPDAIAEIRIPSFAGRGEGRGVGFFARQLRDQIRANGDTHVIIIGHSRGGIVGAHFAEFYAAAAGITVHAAISICSPFAGSDLAGPPFTWFSDSVKEMQPDCGFLKTLTTAMERSSVKYHYFAAQKDWIVAPAACCIPAHADRLVDLNRHDHLSIMTSHRLVARLLAIFKETLQQQEVNNDANTCRRR